MSWGRQGDRSDAPCTVCGLDRRLVYLAGGELDQIRFLLGHVSIQTTERCLG